jgi:HEAT repeat protein
MRRVLPVVLMLCTGFALAQDAPPPAPAQTPEQPAAATPAAKPEKKQTPREEAWEILRTGAQNNATDRRVKAIGVLGLVPDNPEARRFAEAALQDGESSVRASAATALGEMGSKQSIPLLKQRLDDDDIGVVLACAKALLQLKDDAGYEVYYAVLTGQRKAKGSMLSEQMKILHDPKQLTQIGIEQGLGFVPFAGMGYTAYKMLSKDEVSPVRAAAASALANDPDPESGQALSEAVGDKSWIVRKAALDAVAKRGDPKLLKPVIAAMEDDKEIVMYTAAAAVVHLTDVAAGKSGKHSRK